MNKPILFGALLTLGTALILTGCQRKHGLVGDYRQDFTKEYKERMTNFGFKEDPSLAKNERVQKGNDDFLKRLEKSCEGVTLTIGADGTCSITNATNHIVRSTYTVDGNRIIIKPVPGKWAVDKNQPLILVHDKDAGTLTAEDSMIGFLYISK